MSKPSILVIFGITGDLSQRYLVPALYNLFKNEILDEHTEVLGITRRDVSNEQLFDQVRSTMHELGFQYDEAVLQAMFDKTNMFKMDLEEASEYSHLLDRLNSIEERHGVCMDRNYYLSIPPQIYSGIIELMGQMGLNKSCSHGQATTKILVEKPFGYDLESAKKLLESTQSVFRESQIFRIDHFLTKSGVQDYIGFRMSSSYLDKIWNSEHIHSIEILASENIDIEGRVKFYEPLGALRDFIQNHLVQLLAITTMDLPESLSSDELHSQKERALEFIREVDVEPAGNNATRGQYESYRDDVNNQNSTTETYANITVYSGSPRWDNVPINIWTGKALAAKKYEIIVSFKDESGSQAAKLIYRIQPDEAIIFETDNEGSDAFNAISEAVNAFQNQLNQDKRIFQNAYEDVIISALQGDHTKFASKAEVLNSWRIIQPVINKWATSGDDLIIYKVGQAGPITQ